MTAKQIKNFLKEKPGYLKEGSKRLVKHLNKKGFYPQLSACKEVLKELRREEYKSMLENSNSKPKTKILVYDIETTLNRTYTFWSGKKGYINGNDLIDESKMISIAWKWLGDKDITSMPWDNKLKCDEELTRVFLEEYNKADAVVTINGNSFDNKWINTRAAKHRLFVNTYVKSIDMYRMSKKYLKLPSHSMKYIAKFFGLSLKKGHAGLQMWKDIQWGTPKESALALEDMLDYNIGDIQATEDIYYRLLEFTTPQMHVGVLEDENDLSDPRTGCTDVTLFKMTTTAAGTKQYIMRSSTGLFKLSATKYKTWLSHQ
jgi:DNA polymerase elongation subunit (family B)